MRFAYQTIWLNLCGVLPTAGMMTGPAWGGTIVSQGSGNWATSGTWNGGVPGAGDNVYIRSGDTVTITGIATIPIKTIPINSLSITGTMTHADNTGSSEDHKVNLSVAGNLTIVAGGAINVNGLVRSSTATWCLRMAP